MKNEANTMRIKFTQVVAVLMLAVLWGACGSGGHNASFKPTENEKFTLADINIKGNVSKVVVTTYAIDDPSTKAEVSTMNFDRSGRVVKQQDKDFLNNQKSTYSFSYNRDGSIKGIKARVGDAKVVLRYNYDKRERLRECYTSNAGQETRSEIVWYDPNGWPIKIVSANEPGKYWTYNYDPSGKLLGRSSYLNDGSGTLILNYVYSGFDGNKWTREISQDDMGNRYGSIDQRYNSYGDLEEMNSQAKDAAIVAKVKNQYVYDVMGNWTEMTYTSSINDGTPSVIRKTREITYK